MKAIELKDKYIFKSKKDRVGVIAIAEDGLWWHVHDNEVIPHGYTIAFHPRKTFN